MDSANKLAGVGVDESRSFTISPSLDRKLLDSPELRRALLGTPISKHVRRALINSEMSNRLRSVLISDINKLIDESMPTLDHNHTTSAGPTQESPELTSPSPLGKSQGVSGFRNTTPPASSREVSITNGYPSPVEVQAYSVTKTTPDFTQQATYQLGSRWEQPIRIDQSLNCVPPEKNAGSSVRPLEITDDSSQITGDHVAAGESGSSYGAGGGRREGPSDIEMPDANEYYNVDRHYESREDNMDEDEDYIDSDGSPDAVEPAVRRSGRLSAATTTAAETTANWAYNTWTDPSGEEVSAMGALLPQGYTLHNNPQFPWICPVRSCRRVFCTLAGLGSHFSSIHKASLLNDNGDGTLSVVSKMGWKMPPSVVSKKPLNPDAPPMVEPSFTEVYASRYKTTKGITATSSRLGSTPKGVQKQATPPPTPPSSSLTMEAPLGETGMALWKYIQNKLVCTPLFPIPQKGHVPQLLEHLSRVRNVQFNSRAQPFKEAKGQDISAMIIQVAGTQARNPCSRCRMGKGPFRGCYLIPTSAPLSLRQSILGCANCFYHHNQTYCDLKGWSLKKYPELGGTRHANIPIKAPVACTAETEEQQPERRSMRVACKESLAASTHDLEFPRPDAHSPIHEKTPSKADLPSSLSPSAFNPSQMLELATWEMAPGRIRRDGQNDTISNFAFSNAYLSQNQVVQIGRDISFQVITVKPGNIHSWEASPDKLRLCSIASGKVHFMMHDQEFSMGPNGLVRIQPGVSCTATNKLYIDAMVHVAAIPGDLC